MANRLTILQKRRRSAIVIYLALICLCVSDGIGPRLVPYSVSLSAGDEKPDCLSLPEQSQGIHLWGEDTVEKVPISLPPEVCFSQSILALQTTAGFTRNRLITTALSPRRERSPPRLS